MFQWVLHLHNPPQCNVCDTWGIQHLLWTACLVIARQNIQYHDHISIFFPKSDVYPVLFIRSIIKQSIFCILNVSLLPMLSLACPLSLHWPILYWHRLAVGQSLETNSQHQTEAYRYFPIVADIKEWQRQCEWSEQIPTEKENVAFPSLKQHKMIILTLHFFSCEGEALEVLMSSHRDTS